MLREYGGGELNALQYYELCLCAHWATAHAIDAIERELGVNVMTSQQAILWNALRTAGINDRIEGYGRLLREF